MTAMRVLFPAMKVLPQSEHEYVITCGHPMDLFKRPPAIAEDTLQYVLHPGPTFPDKSSVTTLATVIDAYVSSLLPNHIWHKDAFELKLVNDPYGEYQWSIEGRMRVGDCVDDEWCVVWLLKDISQQWDVAVRYASTYSP